MMTCLPMARVGTDICIVTYAWFPNNQTLWDALQRRLPYRIRQFVVSERDPNRAWQIPDDAVVPPVVVPGYHVSLLSRYVSFNPSLPKYLTGTDPCAVVVDGWGGPSQWWVQQFAQRRRIPLITWMCGRDPRTRYSLSGRPIRAVGTLMARRLIRHSRFVFVYGSVARDEALQLGADPDRTVIVRQSIDEQHFERTSRSVAPDRRVALRAGIGADERPLFLCVSQLVPRKGIADLLQAFRLVRSWGENAQLLLIGAGTLEPLVRAACAEARGSLIWLPSVPYEEIPVYYALADCFVFPTHFDAWGNVVNESHCARLPVITSDGAQAVADLVEHRKTGLVYAAGDVHALAKFMQHAMNAPGEMRAFASQGYELIRSRWNVEESAGIWTDHLLKAVESLSSVA